MMFDLTGKTAFVTGSLRGIGRAGADALASQGAAVLYHGTGRHLVPELDAVYGDLGNPDDLERITHEVRQKIGVPDILVLNASSQSYVGVENFRREAFDEMMKANVAASFQLIQCFAPDMATRGGGRIIGVGSVNQYRPATRLAVYAATKAALANLFQVTAKLYADRGVTANMIVPGVIDTDRNREALLEPETRKRIIETIPMKRLGKAEDCAGALVFLASDEASYVTGAEIPVSGGF